MPHFEIMPGLPPYGPPAVPFSATGQGTHSEGFVVRITRASGDSWTGNFQRGFHDHNSLDTVLDHPDGKNLIVIAGGQGYIVDVDLQRTIETLSFDIRHIVPVPELRMLLFGDYTAFEAIGSTGKLWRSDRISWDGMTVLNIEGSTMHGHAWSPFTESNVPFTLDLQTGNVTGGSYRDAPQRRSFRRWFADVWGRGGTPR